MRHRIIDALIALALLTVLIAEQFINLDSAVVGVAVAHTAVHIIAIGALLGEAFSWHRHRHDKDGCYEVGGADAQVFGWCSEHSPAIPCTRTVEVHGAPWPADTHHSVSELDDAYDRRMFKQTALDRLLLLEGTKNPAPEDTHHNDPLHGARMCSEDDEDIKLTKGETKRLRYWLTGEQYDPRLGDDQ